MGNFQIQCTDNNGAWNGANSTIIQQERKRFTTNWITLQISHSLLGRKFHYYKKFKRFRLNPNCIASTNNRCET